MIIFKYKVSNVDQCRLLMELMELPGYYTGNKESEDKFVKVWEGNEFIGLFNREDDLYELYATKNTNSINYFLKRYPKLEYDDVMKIPTKRW